MMPFERWHCRASMNRVERGAGRPPRLRTLAAIGVMALVTAACAGDTEVRRDAAGTGDQGRGDPDASSAESGAPGFASDEATDGIEVEYIAHASFLLRAEDGTELLIDPYASRVWLGYDWPEDIEPDAILITHPHYDHDAGRYREMPFPWGSEIPIVDAPGSTRFGTFTVTGVEGKHADPYGKEFGQLNTMMVIEAAGLRIVHLGDNGPLTSETVAGLGRVDVLMLPADGVDHIISPETTDAILTALAPKLIIPMHYRLPDLETEADSPSGLGDLDGWLEGREGVRRVGGNRTTISRRSLPAEREILVFEHAPYVTRPTG
jgi:L-ascorbate metabolism protein UlaG (beta-lactamase superfamily)